MSLRPTKEQLERDIDELVEAAQQYDGDWPDLAYNFRWEARVAYRQLKSGWYRGGESRPKVTIFRDDPFTKVAEKPGGGG